MNENEDENEDVPSSARLSTYGAQENEDKDENEDEGRNEKVNL